MYPFDLLDEAGWPAFVSAVLLYVVLFGTPIAIIGASLGYSVRFVC